MSEKIDLPLSVRKVGGARVFDFELVEEGQRVKRLVWLCKGGTFEEARLDEFKSFLEKALDTESASVEVLKELFEKVWPEEEVGVVWVEQEVVWIACRGMDWRLIRGGTVWPLVRAEGHDVMVVSGWWQGDDELIGVWDQGVGLDADGTRDLWLSQLRLMAVHELIEGGWMVMGERFENFRLITGSQPDEEAIEEVEPVPREEMDVLAGESEHVGRKKKWWVTLAQKMLRWLPQEEAIYVIQDRVDAQKPGKRRTVVLVAAGMVLVVLLGSLGYGVWMRKDRIFEQQFGALLEEVQFKINESLDLATLNPLRSEALLSEVDGVLAELEKRGLATEQLAPLKRQVQKARNAVKGIYDMEPTTWLRFELIREDIKAKDWAWSGELMSVLDGAESRVMLIDLNKSPVVLAGKDEVGDARWTTLVDDVAWIVNGHQLIRLEEGQDPVMYELGSGWGEVLDVSSFGESLYLLTMQGIWKVTMDKESKQLVGEQWLSPDLVDVWLPRSVMTIDGLIWVADGQGITKLVRGKEDVFNVAIDEPWGEITDLYTTEESARLYVLDRAKNRVVVLDKDTAKVEGEYHWAGLGEIKKIAVNESLGEMWWLGESQIFEVRLEGEIPAKVEGE